MRSASPGWPDMQYIVPQIFEYGKKKVFNELLISPRYTLSELRSTSPASGSSISPLIGISRAVIPPGISVRARMRPFSRTKRAPGTSANAVPVPSERASTASTCASESARGARSLTARDETLRGADASAAAERPSESEFFSTKERARDSRNSSSALISAAALPAARSKRGFMPRRTGITLCRMRLRE